MEKLLTTKAMLILIALILTMLGFYYVDRNYYKNHYGTNPDWVELKQHDYSQYRMRFIIDQHFKEALVCADFKDSKIAFFPMKIFGIILRNVSPGLIGYAKKQGLDMSCPNDSTYYSNKLELLKSLDHSALSLTNTETHRLFDAINERYIEKVKRNTGS